MKKLKKLWVRYGLLICVICCLLGIAGYFFNIMFLQNKEAVLNVLVLSSQIDSNEIVNEIEKVIEVGPDEEIEVKYMDTSGNEANRAIILTWIRAKTVDLVIGEKEQLDFFLENGCLLEIDEELKELEESRYYKGCLVDYDSEGNVVGREEEKKYGIYVEQIAGADLIEVPVVSLAVNYVNKENALNALEFYINQK